MGEDNFVCVIIAVPRYLKFATLICCDIYIISIYIVTSLGVLVLCPHPFCLYLDHFSH
jgi:hypothetical protein